MVYKLNEDTCDLSFDWNKELKYKKIPTAYPACCGCIPAGGIKTQADVTEPKVSEEPVTITQGETIPDEAILTKISGLPEGAKAVVKVKPDTDEAGDKIAIVTITYADGSTDGIEVPIKVAENTSETEEQP